MLPSSVRNWWGRQPQGTLTAHFRRFMRVARTLKKPPAVVAADTATNYVTSCAILLWSDWGVPCETQHSG